MSDIEIGEYIRTKNGKIGKVIDISNVTGKYLIRWNQKQTYYISQLKDITHSKDIRGILKKGDLIFHKYWSNGNEKLSKVDLYLNRDGTYSLGADFYRLEQLKITRVITKEELLKNCYELGD